MFEKHRKLRQIITRQIQIVNKNKDLTNFSLSHFLLILEVKKTANAWYFLNVHLQVLRATPKFSRSPRCSVAQFHTELERLQR